MAIKKAPVKKTAEKATTKPAAAKTVAAKKPVAKPAAAKAGTAKPAAKVTKAPAKKPGAAVAETMTKTQIVAEIAEATGLAKKEITAVFDELAGVIERHVKKNAVGVFNMPGLFKIQVVRKPATKARKGINPFTGEETVFKAKPARNTIKLRPLKKLKDMAI